MIYVDVTHVLQYFERGVNLTGIQRVTTECVMGLRRMLGVEKVRIVKCDEATKSVSWASIDLFAEIVAANGNGGHKFHKESFRKYQWQVVSASADDVLLLIEGLGWTSRYQAFEKLKARTGIRVYQIIHDVIPIAVPEVCTRPVVRGFKKVIPLALGLADEILAVSDYTRRDLVQHCSGMIRAGVPIHVWKLPHEFPVPENTDTLLPENVDERFVVFGGTIEDRKNQHAAVRAWRELSAKHGRNMPQLVLVGRYGKLSWPLLKTYVAIKAESFGTQRIVALTRCDDATLRALYDRCLFSVYVSTYEGWGLPIGESLWCGKPVIASTATSLPEVGGPLVDYVALGDDDALIAAIEKLAFNNAYREERRQDIAQAKLRDWNDAVKSLLTLLAPRQTLSSAPGFRAKPCLPGPIRL